MDPINAVVSRNIKRLRAEKRLSLDDLSRLSGVSKSMIAQIERGDGNPTVSTLWKLSNGMQVPFDALTLRAEADYQIVRLSELDPLIEGDGSARNYPLFPDDEGRRFAVYYLTLDPGSHWQSEAHLPGVQEYITVAQGALALTAGEQTFSLREQESLRFRADVPHAYRNPSEGETRLYMILFNP